jgi:hypothetical protein
MDGGQAQKRRALTLPISRTIPKKKILCKTTDEAYVPFDTCNNQKYRVPNLCLLFTLGYGDILAVFSIFIYNADD